MKYSVLFVDDEPMVLDSLRRTLHREPFFIETASSGEEALRKMKLHAPAVVISDMRMPEMDGIAFLTEAQKISPNSVYMVLSAYSDIEKIMQAINERHVWRYIAKPWQKEDLRMSIQNALEMYEYREVKRDLLEKLEVKNKQLSEVNALLEDKVRERTIQLQNKNEILQMLIEDVENTHIVEKICVSIAEQLQVSPVFINVPFIDLVASDCGARPSEALLSLGAKAMVDKKEIVGDEGTVLLLSRGETVLGSILIPDTRSISGFRFADSMGSYISIATLCLIQAYNMHQTPGLAQKIDSLVEGL